MEQRSPSIMLGDLERHLRSLDTHSARRGDSHRERVDDLVHLDEPRLLDDDVPSAVRRLDPREADPLSSGCRAADAEARVSKMTVVQHPECAAAPASTFLAGARTVVARAEACALAERDALALGSDPLDEGPSWSRAGPAPASSQACIRARSRHHIADGSHSGENGRIADSFELHRRRGDPRAVHSSLRHGVVSAAPGARSCGKKAEHDEEPSCHQEASSDDPLSFGVTSSSRPVAHRCSSSPLGTYGSRCSSRMPRPSLR